MKEMTLEERKQCELNILCYIDDVCRNNSIEYFLFGGTLIGAIRHNGFIPWDDDIDITLMRNDYERLIAILKQSNEFNLLYPGMNEYYYQFAKLCDPKTYVKEDGLPYVDGLGVWVDIFPLDEVPDDIEERKAFFDECINEGEKLRACIPGLYYYSDSRLKSFFKRILFYPKVLPYRIKGLSYWENRLIELNQKFNGRGFSHIGVLPTKYGVLCSYHRNEFESSIRHSFEDSEFSIPEKYDAVLRHMYGDYMKLPPEEQRILPHTAKAYWR